MLLVAREGSTSTGGQGRRFTIKPGMETTLGDLSELDRMLIEHRCARLVKQFFQFNDQGRFEELVALFTPDGRHARPTDPTNPLVGREAILAAMKARAPRTTRHILSNVLVTVESPDTASSECYVVLYTGPARGEGQAGPVKADATTGSSPTARARSPSPPPRKDRRPCASAPTAS
jgi:hypothetical protein